MRWERMAKVIFASINHFISYSEFLKSKLIKAGVHESNITVIPYGVDYENIDLKKGRRNSIVFSGRLNQEKGVDLLFRAISKIEHKELETVIIGDGPQRKEYEQIARKLGVEAKFTSWLNDRKEYFDYLKNAICVVVPSLWIENCPLVIGEAFACGTPVIGTNSGGIKELINDSGAGFVVERDPDEIAEKIRVLVENTMLRDEMGEKGREYAEKHFNWEKNVEKLVKVYEKILAEKK
jgi:glycosyltransferase involved in cell wall biosynthesis